MMDEMRFDGAEGEFCAGCGLEFDSCGVCGRCEPELLAAAVAIEEETALLQSFALSVLVVSAGERFEGRVIDGGAYCLAYAEEDTREAAERAARGLAMVIIEGERRGVSRYDLDNLQTMGGMR